MKPNLELFPLNRKLQTLLFSYHRGIYEGSPQLPVPLELKSHQDPW